MSGVAADQLAVVRRGHQWLRIAVVASLALNLLTFGIIIASLWQWRQMAEAESFSFPGQLLEFSKTLPASKQGELRSMVSKAEPEIQPLRDEVRQARREAVRSFLADPFDREQFIAANGRLIQEELKARQAQLGIMAEVSAKLSADERRAFLKWRRENRPNYWRRPGGGPGATGAAQAPQARQP